MVVCPTLYFPPVSFFSAWLKHPPLCIEQQETYQKRSLRNKCHILGASGVVRLTVPLRKGKHEQQDIRHTIIAYDEDWSMGHLRTLQSCYGKAPFYAHYIDGIAHELRQKHERLIDLNHSLLCLIASHLHIQAPMCSTFLYAAAYEQEVIDYRNDFGLPKVVGNRKAVNGFPSYEQVFADRYNFIPNLSILDALFCLGPESRMYVERIG